MIDTEADLRQPCVDSLKAWAKAQIAPWAKMGPIRAQELDQRLQNAAMNEAGLPHLFLYDFSPENVVLRWEAREHSFDLLALSRACMYRDLFRAVVRACECRYSFTLGVDVWDEPVIAPGLPIFTFQKPEDADFILLPDVDLLERGFFLDERYQDVKSFDEKKQVASFVGATTGGSVTIEAVNSLSLQRLRSAVFFRDIPEVDFRIAKIVQYHQPEVVDMIKQLGIFGTELDWSEQLDNRYLISMDGNGATCSRVAIALLSNSVLLKYASPHRLFYFDGLRSGREMISISDDEEVRGVVAEGRKNPAKMHAIAQLGRVFAQRYLTRIAIMTYTAYLLDDYAMLFSEGREGRLLEERSSFLVDAHGHFALLGDRRSTPGSWLGARDAEAPAMEGFTLEPGPQIAFADLEYQAVLGDGKLSAFCISHDFCGTRGRSQPLRGLKIGLRGDAAAAYRLSYEVAFQDGTVVGPVSGGTLCQNANGSALVGFRMIFQNVRS